MDSWLFHLFNDILKNDLLDRIVPLFSDKNLIILPGVVVVCLILFFGRRHARTCILALALALIISDAGSERVFKPLIGQLRPYAIEETANVHRGNQWIEYDRSWYGTVDRRSSHGFPSSHASNMAALAVVLFFLDRRTLWVAAPLAVAVGYSRVYTGNHYPFQVLAGFAWGVCSGLIATKLSFYSVRRFLGSVESTAEKKRIPPAPERLAFYWLFAFWSAANMLFLFSGIFSLSGDEAQYWDWSRHLDFGYYSKPPMIAYVIHLLTRVGGNSEWAIRSGALLFTGGTVAFIYALTLRIARSETAALIAAVTTLAMPATWVMSVIMTIDPLLIFFWVLAMYAFHRALEGHRFMWQLTGLSLGMGVLSKYTMLLLLLSFVLYLLIFDRKTLRKPGPYIALALMLVCNAGVFYWNWSHDWVSFRHTAAIGARDHFSLTDSFRFLGEYIGGQIGVVSPILFGFIIWAWIWCLRRMRINRDAAFLALCFGVLFVFYLLVSITRAPQVNWPGAAYPAACIAFGWAWCAVPRTQRIRTLLVSGIVLACVLGMCTRASDILYLMGTKPESGEPDDRLHLFGLKIDPSFDPIKKLRGGPELGAALTKYVTHHDDPFLFADRYQNTALMAFYTPGKPRTYCIWFDRRMNQYDLWGGWEDLKGRDGIYVTGGDVEKAQLWVDGLVSLGLFDEGEVLETVYVLRGYTIIKAFTISRLQNFSGTELKPDYTDY